MPPKKPKLTQTKLSFGTAAKPSDAATVTVEDSTPIRIDCDTDSEIASTSATGTSSTCSTHSGSTAAAKKERSFQLKWKTLHPWLRYDEESKAMFCTVCSNAGCKNVFTTSGCKNFRASALSEHLEGKDHKDALVVPAFQENQEAMESKMLSESRRAVLARLKAMNWIVKEDLPLSKYESLVILLSELRTPDVHVAVKTDETPNTATHDSRWSAGEFLKALSDVVEEEVKEKLALSPYVTVLADESTDVAVNKKLVIYVQITDPRDLVPSTLYLTDVTLSAGTGKAIAEEIIRQLRNRGVEAEKIMGLGSDGAQVMTGPKEGVTGIMKRHNPHIVNVHCVAHRFNLCTSQAASGVKMLDDFQKVLCDLFYYFKSSATRCAKLKAIQEILDTPKLKVKEVHGVRWLSFFEALETIFRTLEALLTYLDDQSKQNDPKAAGLRSKIATVKFISMAYILMDVIPVVGKLNLFFQKENVDVAVIKVNVDHCIHDLKKLLEEDGFYQTKLREDLDVESHIYKGEKGVYHVSGCPAEHIVNAKNKFLEQLIHNIENRFPDGDFLTAFGALGMRPLSVLTKSQRETWGNEDIQTLVNHYGHHQMHRYCVMEDGKNVEKTSTSPPVISPQAALSEWVELKEQVVNQKYPRDNISQLWQLIGKYHQEQFPNMIKLGHLALSSPVHTAGCERGFSAQNLILTPLRNRLGAENQDMLLRVKLYPGKVDPNKALSAWEKNKTRRF